EGVAILPQEVGLQGGTGTDRELITFLIASPEDIQRYYIQNTRRKATVLHHHLEETRLYGLTGRQMEIKQLRAAKNLGPLYYYTGSPYALPVPFCSHSTSDQSLDPSCRLKSTDSLGKGSRSSRNGTNWRESDGSWKNTLPEMRFPKDKLERMKAEGYTVEMKDCMMERRKRFANEALTEFRRTLKEASVINARTNLKNMLRADFPTLSERDRFIEVYQRYLPIDVRDVRSYSLWVRPAGYQEALTNKPLYTDRFAFGSKLL
ncbi:uncharacterized protein CEXT_536491, partial [Caerostris extrusa]